MGSRDALWPGLSFTLTVINSLIYGDVENHLKMLERCSGQGAEIDLQYLLSTEGASLIIILIIIINQLHVKSERFHYANFFINFLCDTQL